MRTLIVVLVILAAGAAVVPAFLTAGACTAEFDAVGTELENSRAQLPTLPLARRFLDARAWPYAVLSNERCESAKPRDVDSCPDGPLVWGKVPVRNLVCRVYRDDSVHFQMAFDDKERLVRMQVHMAPYLRLRIPFYGESAS
ncbi:MAG TPA: hypothetical protein VL994_06440 [Steroidobacteraceae bacterium]|nr:hypothetical protein [Steroidobacteraceae bacterium]